MNQGNVTQGSVAMQKKNLSQCEEQAWEETSKWKNIFSPNFLMFLIAMDVCQESASEKYPPNNNSSNCTPILVSPCSLKGQIQEWT